MNVHGAICDALGVDDITFQYATVPLAEVAEATAGAPERSRGFSIQMERKLGRGGFKIALDNPNIDNPVRLLLEYTWPPSREHAYQDLDTAAEAVFEALGPNWQRVLAEARVRGHLEAQGGSAITFMTEHALRLDPARLSELEAPVSFLWIGLETPAGDPTSEDPLRQPKREARLDVLREDPRSLYVELMSQWPQLAPASNGSLTLDARRIRSFDNPPSAYLQNCMAYLSEQFFPLFGGAPNR